MRRLMDKRHRPDQQELLSLHALYYGVYPGGGTTSSVKLHTQKNVSRIQEKQKTKTKELKQKTNQAPVLENRMCFRLQHCDRGCEGNWIASVFHAAL